LFSSVDEHEGIVVIAEAITEDEGKEEETGGEEVLLIDNALTNRSPNEP